MNNFRIGHCFISTLACIFFTQFFFGCTKETIKQDLNETFEYEPKQISPGINSGAIYSTKNFAAFTDIVYYNNQWFVTFRAGTQHLGGLNGQIKIMTSKDRKTWKVAHIIENDSLDLRGPKFILDSANNVLYINFFGTKDLPGNSDKYRIYNYLVSYTAGTGYSVPELITNDNTQNEMFAFWRYTYHKGKFFSAAYRIPILGGYNNDNLCLFNNSANYWQYSAMGRVDLGKSPNETTIRFDKDENLYYLVRREAATVALGVASPADYSKVKWIDDPIGIRLSSPNFLFYLDKLLICGRDQDKLTFKLFSYNLNTNKIEKSFTFPSGVETGYGGMSFDPSDANKLLMSYYVITSSKSYINLVEVDLNIFLQ